MATSYFIRRGEVILGPFSEERLRQMFHSGEIASMAMLSPDKKAWRPLSEIFSPPAPPAPPIPAAPETGSAREQDATVPPRQPSGTVASAGSSRPALQTAGDTVSLLWNSSDYLLRLGKRGPGAVRQSCILAAVLAFFLAGLGLALFGLRYHFPPLRFGGAVLGAVPLTGLVIQLECALLRRARRPPEVSAELDRLAAALGMLNLAAGLLFTLALAFFFDPALYRPGAARFGAAAGLLAVWIFFPANMLTGIRLNLIVNHDMSPCRATWFGVLGLWAAAMLCGALFRFLTTL